MTSFTRSTLLSAVTAAAVLAAGLIGGGQDAVAAPASTTFTPLPATTLPGDPSDVAVSGDGRYSYVVGSGGLTKLDVTTSPPTTLGTNTSLPGSAIAIARDGRTAYEVSGAAGANTISVVDITGSTPQLISRVTFPVNGALLHGVAVSPSGQQLWVSYGDGEPDGLPYGVYEFSIANRTPTPIGRGSTQPYPVDVAITPDGTKVLTADGLGYTVSVLNASTRATVATISLPDDIESVAVAPDGRYAYAIGHFSGDVYKIDLQSDRLVATAAGIADPIGGSIAVSPDSNYVYADFATGSDDASLFVLNASDLSTVQHFSGLLYSSAVAVSDFGSTRGVAYLTGSQDLVGGAPAALFPLQQSPVGGQPAPIPVASGPIVASASGRCVGTVGGALTNAVRLVLATCTGGANQQWTMLSDGSFRLGGMCITVSSHSAGEAAYLFQCVGSERQAYFDETPINGPAGTSVITNASYGGCLIAASTAVGSAVTTGVCSSPSASNSLFRAPGTPVPGIG